MPPGKFTLSYIFLTEDCSGVRPQSQGIRENLDEAAVRGCLEAFAAIPATSLTEVDARIRLRFHQQHLMVSRSGEILYFTPIPELNATPERSTPEGILAYLTGTERMEAPPPAEAVPIPARRKPRWSLGMPLGIQIAVLVILGSIIAGLLHHQLDAPPPAGYVLIKDSTRINSLQRQLDGQYGSPGDSGKLQIRISQGRVSFFEAPQSGAPRKLVKEEGFRFALRGPSTVALLGTKGDILEINPDGSLLFGEYSYPRTGQ